MPQPRKAKASPVKGEADAARQEVTEQQARTITWQGLELTIPAEAPASLWFDLEDADSMWSQKRFIEGFIGREQMRAVRTKVVDEDGLTLEQFAETALPELLDAITGAYGLTAGDS